jgi:hypothetical protein
MESHSNRLRNNFFLPFLFNEQPVTYHENKWYSLHYKMRIMELSFEIEWEKIYRVKFIQLKRICELN